MIDAPCPPPPWGTFPQSCLRSPTKKRRPKYTITIETENSELNEVQKAICEQITFLVQRFKKRDKTLSEIEATVAAMLLIERVLDRFNPSVAKEIIEIAKKSKYGQQVNDG